MSSDMPSVITSTVEHFGSPRNVDFTAYGVCIHTIFLNRFLTPKGADERPSSTEELDHASSRGGGILAAAAALK